MKESIARLKSLLSMKSSLVKALAGDLENALVKIDQRDARIEAIKLELEVYVGANQSLRNQNQELLRLNNVMKEDVTKYRNQNAYLSDKLVEYLQEIELLKSTVERQKDTIEMYKKDIEWWREMDEDEDYQASLEVSALPDISFDDVPAENRTNRECHEEEL